VHMLSTHSFNALLKTLEEPPEHVKFLLATTDPQRLPVTVLSRCLQFNLKPLLPQLISAQLEHIASAENIETQAAALQRLARAADGSMRDALSLMDQALAFSSGALYEAEVADMLGSLEQDFLLNLLECLASADGPGLLAGIDRLADASPDFTEALAELLALLHQITLIQTVPESIDTDAPDAERLQRLAAHFDSAGVQLLYQIALHGRRDLPLAPDPRAGFEMTMLRMLAFEPDCGAASQQSPKLASRTASVADKPAQTINDKSASASVAAPEPSIDHWHAMVAELPVSGVTQALARHCEWGGREGDQVTLKIDEGHVHLLNDNVKSRLAEALSRYFDTSISVNIAIGGVEAETPAELAVRTQSEREAAAHASIAADPNIAALKATFGAEVIDDSIRPDDQESKS